MTQNELFYKRMLYNLKKMLKSANIELAQLPQGRLAREKRGNAWIFFQVETVDGKRLRKGITRDSKTIQALARKEYIKEEIKILEKDINALERFCGEYIEPIYENIITSIPEYKSQLGIVKNDLPTWASTPYEQSTFKTEAKIHTSSRGLKVRSKSELSIVELLYAYEVPFRYEEILHLGKYNVSTDFILRNKRTQKQFYWEHCGMVCNEKYLKHHKWKIDLYESVGIVPWDNLIVTYDGLDGTLNLSIIESEIINKLI